MDFLTLLSAEPIPELLGGMLIGSACALLLLVNGRIAGISGIVGGLFARSTLAKGWRIAFLTGLFLGGYGLGQIDSQVLDSRLPLPKEAPGFALLLVGLGVGLANGCTSGHGICGLARRSKRSLVATLLFMLTAMVTATWLRAMP